jgi:hypothetical protein
VSGALDCAIQLGPMCFRDLTDFFVMLGALLSVVAVAVLVVFVDRRLRAKRQRTDDKASDAP